MQTNENDNTRGLGRSKAFPDLPEDPQQVDPQDSRVREIIF